MSGIENSVNGVKSTFSSWDSCMSKVYCKWPVIVGIIIGSLILLSVLYCVFQILCCGAQCCFCFASITKCLCCGCCRGSGRGHGRRDDYGSHAKNNGYVQPSDYNTSYQPSYAAQPQYRSQAPPNYAAPSTATFESPAKGTRHGHDDALPAMPSWSDAQSRQVEDHSHPHDDVEMGNLKNAGQSEPMLPKFETDDYKYGRGDSVHGMGNTTGDLGLGAGAVAANSYRDAHSRQDTYGAGRGPSPSPYNSTQQYGQAQNTPYGQTQRNASYQSQGQGLSGQNYPQHQQSDPMMSSPYNHSSNASAAGTAYSGAHNDQQAYPSHDRAQSPTYPASQQPQQQSYHYDAPTPTSPVRQTPQPQQSYTAYPGQSSYQPADAASAAPSYRTYESSDPPARKPAPRSNW